MHRNDSPSHVTLVNVGAMIVIAGLSEVFMVQMQIYRPTRKNANRFSLSCQTKWNRSQDRVCPILA